jgi:hypothetical protein
MQSSHLSSVAKGTSLRDDFFLWSQELPLAKEETMQHRLRVVPQRFKPMKPVESCALSLTVICVRSSTEDMPARHITE